MAGLAAFLAAACHGPAPAPRHHQVAIESLVFSPATLVVHSGDTVTWTNRDIVPHTIAGAGSSWDSGDLPAGASFTMVVAAEHAGEYRCAYHPTMIGTLSQEE
jgi:plastocyanin